MAESSGNPTDTAICRLLAGGPLPTAVIAGRLGAPERTVRHRLHRLREAGAVVTGSDGLHRLAGAGTVLAAQARLDLAAPARPDLAASVAGNSPVSDRPPGDEGHWPVLAVLAAIGIGLAAVAVARLGRPDRPPEPPSPYGYAGGWHPGPEW